MVVAALAADPLATVVVAASLQLANPSADRQELHVSTDERWADGGDREDACVVSSVLV